MREDSHRNDRLLIAGVAGCVVAGAAAIALFGSLAVDPHEPGNTGRAMPASAEEVLADRSGDGPVLASLTPAAPSDTSLTVETTPVSGIEVLPPACAPFEGESAVDAGLRAWTARDHETAAACFDEAAVVTPDRPWIEYMRALSLWKSGDLDSADAAMVHALALDAGCARCAVNLSRIRNDSGAFEGALEAARAAVAIDPFDVDARYLEGRSLRNLGRTAEAIDSLRAAIESRPDHGHARNLLGLTLLEADRELEAVVELEIARDLLPEVAYVRNNLGMAYERSGERSAAVVEYRAAIDLEGDGGKSATNLSRLDPLGTIENDLLMAAIEPVEETVVAVENVDGNELEVAAAEPDQPEDADGTDPETGPGTP